MSAQPLLAIDLPRSAVALQVVYFEEFIEAVPQPRLLARGPLSFTADPPADFMLLPPPATAAAIAFRHAFLADTGLQVYIYRNEGPTRFDVAAWNAFLQLRLAAEEPQQVVESITGFVDDGAAGPPLMGYLSRIAGFVVRDPETGRLSRHEWLLAPVEGTPWVVLITLRAEPGAFDVLRRTARAFAASLGPVDN